MNSKLKNLLSDYLSVSGEKVKISGDELTTLCPFHDDNEASLSINLETGLWKCHASSCAQSGGGNLNKLLSLLNPVLAPHDIELMEDAINSADVDEDDAVAVIKKIEEEGLKLKVPSKFPITVEEIEARHKRILQDPAMIEKLKETFLWTEDTIKRFKIGWHPTNKRLWIPIVEGNTVVNIRQYGPRKTPKIRSVSNFGAARLWPIENLNHDTIYIMEGEKDCILANQLGLNAITVTGGAGTFKSDWITQFLNKTVYICYDIDPSGVEGAKKVGGMVVGPAKSVRIIKLPITSPSNADFSDYISQGHTIQDFYELQEKGSSELEKFDGKINIEIPDDLIETSLDKVAYDGHIYKKTRMPIRTVGGWNAPFLFPRKIRIRCNKGSNRNCKNCGVFTMETPIIELSDTDKTIIRLIECSDKEQERVIKDLFKLPKCLNCSVELLDHQFIDVREMIPSIDFQEYNKSYDKRMGYFLNKRIEVNSEYVVDSIAVPHPKTQELVHIVYDTQPCKNSVSEFKLTDEIREQLQETFQRGVLTVAGKMNQIHNDLSMNVTQIYQRENLHLAIDLMYHSVLRFRFDGKLLKKGYPEILVVGDTRCGKSETAERLLVHYGLGAIASGENATFAGLIGACVQFGNKWYVSWGKIPLNNERLLIIDELSGVSHKDIENMSSIRSSGIAEITKVESAKTAARTRLLWLSNPRADRPINHHRSGIQVIKDLIGKPEDIARFDCALILAEADVARDTINDPHFKKPEHTHISDACRNLVLWAWSRKAEQIKFKPEAVQACKKFGKLMYDKYSSDCPIVNASEQKVKLARLAVATACRLFNCDETGENVIVEPEHVEFIYEFLCREYDRPGFAYNEWSDTRGKDEVLAQPKKVTEILVQDMGDKPKETARLLLEHYQISVKQIEDMTGFSYDEAKAVVSKLLKLQALKPYKTYYVKTPGFVQLLKEYLVGADEDEPEPEF